jgi:tRNA threonylcarbamoyl adenosine modification protein (Sua5/YciO/YrdC/YwlC family)
MSELRIITLSELTAETSHQQEAIDLVAQRITAGEVVIAPLESSYIFLCDAFNQSAVVKIHTLRGDAPGTACQVLIGSAATLKGITQQLPDALSKLADALWPGMLTLMVRPNTSLHWDLGDGGELETFAVRVPDQDFVRAVISKVGPVAIASASMRGQGPALSLDQTSALPEEISLYIDGGTFSSSTPNDVSTVVAMTATGGVDCTRIGAISLEELRKVLPTIGASHL